MSRDRFDHHTKSTSKQTQRITVVTDSGQRQYWTPEKKQRILAESFEDGAVISEVARRHRMRPQQLFVWRYEFRKRQQVHLRPRSAPEPAFAPVMITPSCQPIEATAATLASTPIAHKQASAPIEIIFGSTSIHIHGEVDGQVLAVVLKAVRAAQ